MPKFHLHNYHVGEALINWPDLKNEIDLARKELAKVSGSAQVFNVATNHMIVVATGQDNSIMGFVVWQSMPNNSAFVGLSYVCPDVRRFGIYKEMLKRVADLAFLQGFDKIQLAVAGANKLSLDVHNSLLGVPEVVVYTKPLQA